MTVSWSSPSVRLSIRFDRRGALIELGLVETGDRWRVDRMRFADEDEGIENFARILRMLRGDWR